MFLKSIRWRLQVWQAFLLVCILCGFGVTAYQLNRTNQFRLIDEELERRVAALNADVRGPPPFGQPQPGGPHFEPWKEQSTNRIPFGPPLDLRPFEGRERFGPPRPGRDSKGSRRPLEEFLDSREIRLSPATASLFDEAKPNGFFYGVWSRSGLLLKRSTNAPTALIRPELFDRPATIQKRTEGPERHAFIFTDIGECVLVGRSISADLQALGRFAWLLVAAGGAVLVVGLGGSWLLATKALRPVEEIGATASRISQGNLAQRINLAETESELGRLAGVLNSTFARLEAAFLQQKQFTGDASHELRTPIAVLISEAQTTLARTRTAPEYRETLEACLATAQQMRRLTDSLLVLARLDAGQEQMRHEIFDLAARTRESLDLVRPLAVKRGLQIQASLQAVELSADPDRVGQVVTNLLTNAVFYNREGGEVRVETCKDGETALLSVSDTGPGIAEHDLPHIFERFYRADKARAAADGHTGLGLAICKAIVQAHGGNIEVSSQIGAGASFTMRLPVSFNAQSEKSPSGEA